MGTNYYLRRKCNFNPLHKIPASLGCCDGMEWDPQELVNGWVWNDRYYPDVESLNRDFYQNVHIGKSSAGWRFLLATYPDRHPQFEEETWLDKPIENLDGWIDLFNNKQNKIFDEYGEEISPEDMIDIISKRKGNPKLKDGWQRLGRDRDTEYFVKNGLMVHKDNESNSLFHDRHNYYKITGDECTYDLVLSGNDPYYGYIFC